MEELTLEELRYLRFILQRDMSAHKPSEIFHETQKALLEKIKSAIIKKYGNDSNGLNPTFVIEDEAKNINSK